MWMILVPVSRIMVGAHFASDVTVGVAISLIVLYLRKSIYGEIRKLMCRVFMKVCKHSLKFTEWTVIKGKSF